jgi:transcriptional regulator with XRE-family HTH domain
MDNSDKTLPADANLKIDGEVIRRLREEQGLTQLYVAKVVGVTSDTISRWENNRYPSIKTANAQRLAEALEVEIDRILQQQEDGTDEVDHTSSNARSFRIKIVFLGAGAGVLLMVAAIIWRLLSPPEPEVWADRLLPSYAAPGTEIPVKLTFNGSAARVVVREQIPEGWELIKAAPEPDSFDASSGLMRWILELGEDSTKAIHYIVRVAPDATLGSMQKFNGELVLRSEESAHGRSGMLGANRLVVEHVHWADLNADNRIDDDEMLDASYLAESAENLFLGMEKLEKLWMAEHYYWDSEKEVFVGIDQSSLNQEIDPVEKARR